MAQGQGQAPHSAFDGGADGAHSATRDIGDRARLALIIVATLTLIVTFGEWAQSALGVYTAVAGRTDFSSYYAAALALRENIHANIYSAATLAQAGAKGQTLVNPPLPYTYPPLLAILLSPFTVLSFRSLSRLWMLGNIALWLGSVFVFAIQIRLLLGDALKRQPQGAAQALTSGAGAANALVAGESSRRANQSPLMADPTPLVALALAAVVGLNFAPTYVTVYTGQVNLLVLAPLVLIPILSWRRHERWVGVMVALAALIKITPILLVGYLLLRRRWEAALSAIVAMAALSLLCIAIVGPGVFFALIPEALKVGSFDAARFQNQALLAPIGEVMGHTLAFKVGEYAALGLLALAFGYALWRAPYPGPVSAVATAGTDRADRADRAELRAHNETETLAFGLAVCAMVLLSPTVWAHHYVWLLPAAIPALALAGRAALTATTAHDRRNALGLLALATLGALALAWTLPFSWDSGLGPYHTVIGGITVWPYALETRPLGSLALAVVTTVLLAGYAARQAPRARWAPVPARALPRIFTEDG